jgi:SAM-dependent methyltransferase
MKQTAISGIVNAELLAMIPRAATRVVEVGCSGGALARQYRLANPRCEYVGIETDPDHAEAARPHCSRMLVGNIEHLPEAEFATLLPADCWVFGDVLEHLYDPWAVLRRIRASERDEHDRRRVHTQPAALDDAGTHQRGRLPVRGQPGSSIERTFAGSPAERSRSCSTPPDSPSSKRVGGCSTSRSGSAGSEPCAHSPR